MTLHSHWVLLAMNWGHLRGAIGWMDLQENFNSDEYQPNTKQFFKKSVFTFMQVNNTTECPNVPANR